MLELNQKVYLPIHKTIGIVTWIGEENGNCHGEVCIKTNENYNVWTDNLGLLAHTPLQIAIPLTYKENENVVINTEDNSMHFGVIKESIVNDKGDLMYKVHFKNGSIHEINPDNIISMESLLDIAITKHNINCEKGIAKRKLYIERLK